MRGLLPLALRVVWGFGLGCAAVAQPLNERVLIVYNAQYPDSLEVAQHYANLRGIPSSHLCAIRSADQRDVIAYASVVRDPVRACLNAVGPSKILYIVMAYLTPYSVRPGSSQFYALDSYVADIWDRYSTQEFSVPSNPHGYYVDSQAAGNFYPAFVPFAAYRAGSKAQLIYSVWRLDGATKDIAKGLADKAVAAEALPAPTGQGCFDMRYGNTATLADQGLFSGDWDIFRASQFAAQAGFATLNDQNPAEFGTAPAPLTCPGALLYTGWYSFNNYNDAFTWNLGAIGWHLDSASALNPRGGSNWVANALQRGITVTAGSTTEPYLQGLPRAGGVLRNLFEGANVGDAFLRNTRWIRWRVLFLGDPLYRPFPGGLPPFHAAFFEDSLQLSTRALVGGSTVQGTVRLASAAPAGGRTVSLASSQTSVATVPPSVTVPAGARSATFAIATYPVTARREAVITAAAPGLSLRNDLAAFPLLGGLALERTSVTGGGAVTAAVVLNDRAPLGGAVVALSSGNPAAVQVPPLVTVPAGSTVGYFVISTAPVAANTPVTLTAVFAGATSQTTLTVTP